MEREGEKEGGYERKNKNREKGGREGGVSLSVVPVR